MNETAQCSKGWGARCARSHGPRCKCRCRGENHGGKPKVSDNHAAQDAVAALLAEIGVRDISAVQYKSGYTYPGLFGRTVVTDLVIIASGPLPVVIVTERSDNPGASITNTIELLAKSLYSETGWQPADMVLIEHYPPGRYGSDRYGPQHPDYIPQSLDLVTFDRMWSGVHWRHIDIAALRTLVLSEARAEKEFGRQRATTQ